MIQKNRGMVGLIDIMLGGFIVLLIGSLLVLWLYGVGIIGPGPEEKAQALEVSRVTQLQKTADDFVGQLEYIKDPTTNLCFALLPSLRTDEIPAFTNVPCDAVQQKLLVIGGLPVSK